MSITLQAAVGVSAGLLLMVSCSSSPNAPSELTPAAGASSVAAPGAHAGHNQASVTGAGSADVQRGIADVRRFLAPFHNVEKAVEYGYKVAAPGPGICISDPVRGGMGYHYTLDGKDLIGDGVVNLLEPEFLVYSPEKNGSVRLSAVDYFVPYSTWPHAEPPSLLGVPFVAEDAFDAWVLHIWAFWPNPDGIFQNYNRDVPLCP